MKSDANNPTYWRSLADLEGSEEVRQFIENEFPEQADQLENSVDRRRFMQLMGASLAFAGVAGAAGCRRWEEERIVPLSRRPVDYIPGKAKHYATAMQVGGVAQSLLVTSYDGRPIKIEGNADHPAGNSGSTAFAQASILGLYDPDRSRSVVHVEGGKNLRGDWGAFAELTKQTVAKGGQHKLIVLSDASTSPALFQLRGRELARVYGRNLRWYEWEPLSRDNERDGLTQALGAAFHPVYDLSKADVVVSLDADLFVDHPDAMGLARGFAAKRSPEDGQMNRFYAVESVFSSTGAVADHRLPLRSELILPLLMAVDAKLTGGAPPAAQFLGEPKIAAFVDAMVEDLRAANGKSAIIVGAKQPPAVHALAAKLNAGGAGQTVTYVQELDSGRPPHAQAIKEVADELARLAEPNNNETATLLILGGNPVYDAPADVKFAAALEAASASGRIDTIHLSLYHDETSAKCNWHLPAAHYLETWGDSLAWDGTYTITQPVIEPLYGSKSALEVVAMFAGRDNPNGRALVREVFDQISQAPLGTIEKAWRKALHDGYLDAEVVPKTNPQVRPVSLPELTARQLLGTKLQNGQLEVTFMPSSHAYDGRYANNAWLQETPDFMTKATWDNVALVSPATAKALGISNYEMLSLVIEGRKVEAPAYVMPGQAPFSIALEVGYGRTRAGQVAGLEGESDSLGTSVYGLRSAQTMWIAGGAKVDGTGSSYPIATTQDHWNIDDRGRETIKTRMGDLIREGRYETYAKNQESWQAKKYPRHLPKLEVESLWDPPAEYEGHKWGMSTDLTKCVGCNACSVACQAENNIPIVGKREVMRSREMHWIRIDRYFLGDIDDPEVVHQPVTCQQCEKAPCEQVCPVGATIHSDEGLNDMVYNRCVGTRYCLNNCPYKVRRFNFFDYHKEFEDSRNKVKKLLFNPEVTVRSRGVMEKCTFCVQRIQAAKIESANEKRAIADGEIKTACQQACPTDAIVFGDLNDKDSRVAKLHQTGRAYAMLHEFNVHPRNLFLARIRNPNPKLAPEAETKSH